jgi:nicotinamide phosphoribosyltransferase
MLTIENTIPEAFWVTNYIETLLSAEIWHPCTSATLAYEFRKLFDHWAAKTGGPAEFTQFQGHDFSMRGMPSLEAAAASGAGHLLSFVGTDTIPSIMYLEQFYNADIEKMLVGTSVPATEHSIMCAYGQNEYESFKRIITECYPSGIISIVSDTWDLWHVLTNVIPSLHQEIMARDGKVVIRPDSGRPADIMCGDPKAAAGSPASLGVIELLWNEFGGTVNTKGYRELDSHIGSIYGDAITYDVAREICERLAEKGFASTNMVYGIGSFTYQYVTRDTFSFALKSTDAVINGEEIQIWKDPVTDPGAVKKSLRGRVVVREEADGNLVVVDHLSHAEQEELSNIDMLKPIFLNGQLLNEQNLTDIRKRLHPCFS